jgi:hypothetical protein
MFFCNKCNKKLCNDCKEYHLNKGKIKHEDNDIKLIKNVNLGELYCKIHQKENLFEYLCLDCERIICKSCCLSEHQTHSKKELKESKEKIKEFNNNIKKKLNNEKENYNKMILSFDENEKEILEKIEEINSEIKKFEIKIKEENNNLEINKLKKQEVLFEYQNLLNFNSISEEEPIQFLLNSNNFFNKNNDTYYNNNDKIYKKILSFGSNESGQLGSCDSKNILTPTLVNFKNLEIKKIILSSNSTFIISSKLFNNIIKKKV